MTYITANAHITDDTTITARVIKDVLSDPYVLLNIGGLTLFFAEGSCAKINQLTDVLQSVVAEYKEARNA